MESVGVINITCLKTRFHQPQQLFTVKEEKYEIRWLIDMMKNRRKKKCVWKH